MKPILGIPVDKQMHFGVGIVAALAFTVLMLVAQLVCLTWGFEAFYKAHHLFFAIIMAGVCVHVAKEGTDWIDNRLMRARGEGDLHNVDPWDAVAGTCGTTAVAVALLLAGWV